MNFKKYISIVALLLPVFLFAQPYYISPTGDDVTGDGSFANPWFNIGYASTQCTAGDTVFAMGGTYDYDEQQSIGVSGTRDNEIVFINYQDETPIFDFWGYDVSADPPVSIAGIGGTDVSYVKFEGLHVRRLWKINTDNGRAHGWSFNYSHNLTFDQCKADSIAGRGMQTHNSFNITTLRCDVWWCADPQDEDAGNAGTGYLNSQSSGHAVDYLPNPGPITSIIPNTGFVNHNDYNFIIRYVSTPVGSFTFQDNGVGITATLNGDVWDFTYTSSGDPVALGVATKAGTNNDSVYYYQCRAWLCADQGFSGGGDKVYSVADQIWSFSNGIKPEFYFGGGSGFKYHLVPAEIDGVNAVIKNSIAVYNEWHGFHSNANDRRPEDRLYNNLSAYNGGAGFYAAYTWDYYRDTRENIFRNNIGYGNSGYDFHIIDTAVHSHNSFDCPVSTHTRYTDSEPNCGGAGSFYKYYDSPDNTWAGGDLLVDDNQFKAVPDSLTNFNLMTAPRQADGSLPDLGDYWQLASTSDFIDVGLDVGLSYEGDGPDLGPFEYVEDTPVDPPATGRGKFGRSGGKTLMYNGKRMIIVTDN